MWLATVARFTARLVTVSIRIVPSHLARRQWDGRTAPSRDTRKAPRSNGSSAPRRPVRIKSSENPDTLLLIRVRKHEDGRALRNAMLDRGTGATDPKAHVSCAVCDLRAGYYWKNGTFCSYFGATRADRCLKFQSGDPRFEPIRRLLLPVLEACLPSASTAPT